MPLALLAMIVGHLAAVHHYGSSAPAHAGTLEKIPFMRYFTLKDGVALALAIGLVAISVLAEPTEALDPEEFVALSTVNTPAHIVPEWYLLSYYAVLRCLASKAAGCVVAVLVIISIALLWVR